MGKGSQRATGGPLEDGRSGELAWESEQVLETGTERAGDEREWLIGRT